jgi:hypothetical protein
VRNAAELATATTAGLRACVCVENVVCVFVWFCGVTSLCRSAAALMTCFEHTTQKQTRTRERKSEATIDPNARDAYANLELRARRARIQKAEAGCLKKSARRGFLCARNGEIKKRIEHPRLNLFMLCRARIWRWRTRRVYVWCWLRRLFAQRLSGGRVVKVLLYETF